MSPESAAPDVTSLHPGERRRVAGVLWVNENGVVYILTRQPDSKVIASIAAPLVTFVGIFTATQTVLDSSTYEIVAIVSLAMIVVLVGLLVWYVAFGSYKVDSDARRHYLPPK
jgi:hypothetical protein